MTGMDVCLETSSTIKLSCLRSRCGTRTNAAPESGGILLKNFLNAFRPPAEAPIPTTGNSGCWTALLDAVWDDSGIGMAVRLPEVADFCEAFAGDFGGDFGGFVSWESDIFPRDWGLDCGDGGLDGEASTGTAPAESAVESGVGVAEPENDNTSFVVVLLSGCLRDCRCLLAIPSILMTCISIAEGAYPCRIECPAGSCSSAGPCTTPSRRTPISDSSQPPWQICFIDPTMYHVPVRIANEYRLHTSTSSNLMHSS